MKDITEYRAWIENKISSINQLEYTLARFNRCSVPFFRGQGCSSWLITSSYNRWYNANVKDYLIKDLDLIRNDEGYSFEQKDNYLGVQELFLEVFMSKCMENGVLLGEDGIYNKEKFQHFAKNMESGQYKELSPDRSSYLYLMQHYGLPTNLIDFSSCPYIALYFALLDSDKSETGFMRLSCTNIMPFLDYVHFQAPKMRGVEQNQKEFTEKRKIGYKQELMTIPHFNFGRIQLNQRIQAQKGTFIYFPYHYPYDVTMDTIKTNFENSIEEQILIPVDMKSDILKLLEQKNINQRTLKLDIPNIEHIDGLIYEQVVVPLKKDLKKIANCTPRYRWKSFKVQIS